MPLIEDDIDISKELEAAERVASEVPIAEPERNVEDTPDQADAADVADVAQKDDELAEAGKEAQNKPETTEKGEKRGDPAIALRIARKEAKELKEQLRKQSIDHQSAVQQLAERLNTLTNPPKDKPTFEEDPLTNLKTELDETKAKAAKIEQAESARQFEQQVKTTLKGYEVQFSKEHADYDDAAGYVVKAIAANMGLMGDPPEQIQQQIIQQIMQTTVNAVRAGKDPAEIIYGMAQNLGFNSKAKADAAASQQKLENMARGQNASQSLSSGGKAEAGQLTVDILSKMDDHDLNAMLDDKKWNEEIRRLMH